MFTANGSIFEVYAVLIGYQQGFRTGIAYPEFNTDAEYKDYSIVWATSRWIESHGDKSANGIHALLEIHGNDATAIAAISAYATEIGQGRWRDLKQKP